MGKSLLLILFMSLLCSKSKAMDLDSMHHVLYQAYIAETDSIAHIYFSQAKNQVVDDSSEGYYNYFKFFYFQVNNTKDKDSAAFYAEKALPLLYKVKFYTEFFRIRNMLFWDMVDKSKYDKAVEHVIKSIEYAKEARDTANWIGTHADLAVAYHDIGEYKKAIETAKSGLRISSLSKFNYDRSTCINAIGISFDDWGVPDSAIYYHRSNLAINKDYPHSLSQTLNNLGNSYSKNHQPDSAKKYLFLALEQDKLSGSNYKLATSMNNLGGILMREKKYTEAKEYLDSALYYSLLSESNEKKRDIYSSLYAYHKAQGDFEQATTYLELYHTFKDSMLNNERVRIINNLEFKAKEAKLSEQVSKAEAATNLRNFWIVLVSGILLVTLLFARQLYLKRKQVAEEAKLKLQNERLRISRDLHDNLGAELTYISSIIDQKAYDIKDPEKRAELENISDSSRHAMDQMRETIWAIKTDEITVSKFIHKVKNTSGKYAKAAQMELGTRSSGENMLMPPSKVIVLFRVCQEAINNAVKYAHGTTISLDMNVENNQYTITISDDGKGFDTATIKKGYGLNNMSERMSEIAGSFELKSIKNKGTTLTLKGPLIT